jgi:hypothetical protein
VKKRTFKGTLEAEGDGCLIRVPFDVKEAFGKARAPVKVSLGKYSYRSTVAVYGGEYFVGVRRSHREAAGVSAGDTVAVALELDTQPRVVEVPADLKKALARHAGAKVAWEKLSFTHQREHIEAIEQAKKPETRTRRVAKAIEMLTSRSGKP